jgi:hypothetical protein
MKAMSGRTVMAAYMMLPNCFTVRDV